jgi:hypothetical protein
MTLEEEMAKASELWTETNGRVEEMWAPYLMGESNLTTQVAAAFRTTLAKIGPLRSKWYAQYHRGEGATISDFKVEYHPVVKKFRIEILDLTVPGIEKIECPHIYLDPVTGFKSELDPHIVKFKQEYHIANIMNPPNDCEHK